MSTKIFSQQKNTILNCTKIYLLLTSFLAPSTPAFLRGFAHVRVRTALEPAKGGFLFQGLPSSPQKEVFFFNVVCDVPAMRTADGNIYIYVKSFPFYLSLA